MTNRQFRDPHAAERGHHLLPAEAARLLPALYATDGTPLADKTLPVKLFSQTGWRWYLAELDPATGTAFGFVTSPLCPDGEWGYVDVTELVDLRVPVTIRFANTDRPDRAVEVLAVERDLHWSPESRLSAVARVTL